MTILHGKSKCCGARIVRFGGKRRRCSVCKKTWRIRPAKRGPKNFRIACHYLNKVFSHNFTVKQLSFDSVLSVDAIYKRFAKSLEIVVSRKRSVRIRGQRLILLMDAEWQYFKGDLWILYFLSAKAVGSETVTVFDPILRQGKENATVWREVIDQLPISVKKRIIVVVSDGVRGIETIAEENGWLVQRCHFHLLSMLQKMRGKRASTPGRLKREEIYCSAKLALSENSKRRLDILCCRLATLARDRQCPKRMRMVIRDFLRRLPDFRTYLEYPELHLPTTVNTMESVNSFIRRTAVTVNTPRSWRRWAIACARFKSKFTCK